MVGRALVGVLESAHFYVLKRLRIRVNLTAIPKIRLQSFQGHLRTPCILRRMRRQNVIKNLDNHPFDGDDLGFCDKKWTHCLGALYHLDC